MTTAERERKRRLLAELGATAERQAAFLADFGEAYGWDDPRTLNAKWWLARVMRSYRALRWELIGGRP